MSFKSYILQESDLNVLKIRSVKKLQWLQKKMKSDSSFSSMADQILFDVKKEKIGFDAPFSLDAKVLDLILTSLIVFIGKQTDEKVINIVSKAIGYFIKGDW